MKCTNHTDREATGICVECGRGLCIECKREVGGKFYCQTCADIHNQIARSIAERASAAQPSIEPKIISARADPSSNLIPLKWCVLGPLIALLGGVFGILAAAYQEAGYGWYIGPFIAAPVFEETIKPCGVYLLLAKKPIALPSQRYTAFLAALAGLSFALIENAMYLNVYIPDHTQTLVVWRYTVCIILHVSCSYIVGLGINQNLANWVKGKVGFLKGNRKYFFGAMAIHGLYNVFAVIIDKQLHWFS
jgi:hypothetical protein